MASARRSPGDVGIPPMARAPGRHTGKVCPGTVERDGGGQDDHRENEQSDRVPGVPCPDGVTLVPSPDAGCTHPESRRLAGVNGGREGPRPIHHPNHPDRCRSDERRGAQDAQPRDDHRHDERDCSGGVVRSHVDARCERAARAPAIPVPPNVLPVSPGRRGGWRAPEEVRQRAPRRRKTSVRCAS